MPNVLKYMVFDLSQRWVYAVEYLQPGNAATDLSLFSSQQRYNPPAQKLNWT